MDPVQDQLMQALVAPAIQMFWQFLPWLIVLGLLVVARDFLVAWIERMIVEFVHDVVGVIRYLFGSPRVSDEAIRRARDREGHVNRMGNKRSQNRKAKVQKSADPVLSAPVPLPPVEILVPTIDKEKQREIDDKHYETYRSELLEAEQKQAEGYDKWILALAGVALTFSLSLVKDFLKPANNADLHSIKFLYMSWILFGLPLALIMFNLQVSYSAYRKQRKILDKHYTNYEKLPDFWATVLGDIRRVKRNHLIESFNWISLFSFLGGIVTLVIFAWKNVRTP